jgi:NADH-quinone oxidoreductase subunit A
MDPNLAVAAHQSADAGAVAGPPAVKPGAGPLTTYEADLYRELGVPNPQQQVLNTDAAANWDQNRQRVQQQARGIALMSLVDIGAFFAVLLVGFAYVWKRGDLDWVRALSRERAAQPAVPPAILLENEPALSA